MATSLHVRDGALLLRNAKPRLCLGTFLSSLQRVFVYPPEQKSLLLPCPQHSRGKEGQMVPVSHISSESRDVGFLSWRYAPAHTGSPDLIRSSPGELRSFCLFSVISLH